MKFHGHCIDIVRSRIQLNRLEKILNKTTRQPDDISPAHSPSDKEIYTDWMKKDGMEVTERTTVKERLSVLYYLNNHFNNPHKMKTIKILFADDNFSYPINNFDKTLQNHHHILSIPDKTVLALLQRL